MNLKILAAAAALSLLAAPALAAPPTGCHGNCSSHDVVNDPSASASVSLGVSSTNTNTANGGTSYAGAYAAGGVGGQGGAAHATGGSVGDTTASVGNVSTGASTSSVGNTSSSSGGNTQETSYVNTESKRPVSTAFATPLNFSSDTCFASATGGAQAMTWGASLGFPFKDKACERRANARTLQLLGEPEAAIIYLSADPEINAAVTEARKRRTPK